MIFSIFLFVLSWVAFLFFADRGKFFNFASTGYLAVIFGLATDLLIHYYPLWSYPSGNGARTFFRHLLDDPGLYFVVTYFFLQNLPQRQTRFTIVRHIFFWSLFSISLEWITIRLGLMKYERWWNIGFSYLADWILYLLFYLHYKWWDHHSNKKTLDHPRTTL